MSTRTPLTNTAASPRTTDFTTVYPPAHFERAEVAPRFHDSPLKRVTTKQYEERKHIMGHEYLGAGLAIGLAALGAGLGIGKLAAAALEGGARQPSVAGDLRITAIITAGLIEGAVLFAFVVANTLAGK